MNIYALADQFFVIGYAIFLFKLIAAMCLEKDQRCLLICFFALFKAATWVRSNSQ